MGPGSGIKGTQRIQLKKEILPNYGYIAEPMISYQSETQDKVDYGPM